MEVGRIAESLLIAGGSILLAYVLYYVFDRLGRWAEGTGTRLDSIFIASADRPVAILVAVLGVYFAVIRVPGMEEFLRSYQNVETAILVLGASWIVASFSHRLVQVYGRRVAASTEGELDDRLVGLGDMLLRYAVLMVGVLMALNVLGVEITPLLAGMGIAGLAVAMAAKDIVSNIFGGVIMTVDRPFAQGDRVEVEGVYGDVIDVGPRSTRIRTRENLVVTIPNKELMNSVLTNYSMPNSKIRVRMPVGVAYGSDLDRVTELCLEVMEGCPSLLESPEPRVFVDEFGESSVNLLVQAWAGDYGDAREAKDFVYREVYEVFDEEGVEMPFPQLDVGFREGPPGEESEKGSGD